jgi:hypothetical protein
MSSMKSSTSFNDALYQQNQNNQHRNGYKQNRQSNHTSHNSSNTSSKMVKSASYSNEPYMSSSNMDEEDGYEEGYDLLKHIKNFQPKTNEHSRTVPDTKNENSITKKLNIRPAGCLPASTFKQKF